MLLLVLILVLVAFGLLVVALLSASSLWAWVSVAVSVAAAAVLLIDFLQRRSAIRAGAEAANPASPGAGADPQVRPRAPEYEPATEILPVVPRSGGPEASPPGSGNRFEPPADGSQTEAMPQVQPPASTDRPSSASGEPTRLGVDQSRNVTGAGVDRTTTSPSGGNGDVSAPPTTAAAPGDQGADGPTMFAPGVRSAPPTTVSGAAPGSEVPSVPEGATGASAEEPPGVEAADEEPPEEPRNEDAAAVVAALETEVIVIDEQPRYHVTTCRSLPGKPTIPLPAREAVELGFTPCGWCNPNATLAAEHTPAR